MNCAFYLLSDTISTASRIGGPVRREPEQAPEGLAPMDLDQDEDRTFVLKDRPVSE